MKITSHKSKNEENEVITRAVAGVALTQNNRRRGTWALIVADIQHHYLYKAYDVLGA